MNKDFSIVVITDPASWEGEADILEGLLEAGLQKLHIRKHGDAREALLQRLAPKWNHRLVVHGGKEILSTAVKYKVPQVHGHWLRPWEILDGPSGNSGPARLGEPSKDLSPASGVCLSASLHSWDEVREVPPGRLEYVFLSPLFDSISKPGYMAGAGLLQRPSGVAPCKLIGLGGIDPQTIGEAIDHGWDGAAVLGYIWERPEMAVERFKILKNTVEDHGR